MKKFFVKVGLFFKNICPNFLKGAVMGVGNVIPGVSGGTLAIILGVYDKMIDAMSNIFKQFKKSMLFLIPLFAGMGIAVVLAAKGVGAALDNFPLATVLFFVGMIVGGLPLLSKKVVGHMKSVSNYIVFAIIFAALLAYTLLAKENHEIEITSFQFIDYVLLFLIGIVGAATMLIPGISGSLTLMVFGYYDLVVGEAVGQITDFSQFWPHMQVLIPFGLGGIVGVLLVSKLLNFLLHKFEVKTYFAIFGFIFASLICIFVINVKEFKIVEFLVGLLLFVVGFALSYFLSRGKIIIGSWEPFAKKEKVEENPPAQNNESVNEESKEEESKEEIEESKSKEA